MKRAAILLATLLWACPFDTSLRQYLKISFWQPFSKSGHDFVPRKQTELSAAFAGMTRDTAPTPLGQLRRIYQGLEEAPVEPLLAAARKSPNLTAAEKEEVELLDAKFAMRDGTAKAKEKFRRFLRSARTPALASEARGWLAHTHFRDDEQSAAGKIYLDELRRPSSILSREVLLNSLSLTYGYDGGDKLREQLADYFDTPEHAEFALQLVTNPRSDAAPVPAAVYQRIQTLLEKHKALLRSEKVATLGMRAALWSGNPAGAVKLAAPATPKAVNPEFLWMLASAHFLMKNYAAAEDPLLRIWNGRQANQNQRAAAAYGLCGVYLKLGNRVEQLRFALLLGKVRPGYGVDIARVEDQSVYFATSGFDAGLLLDAEASIDDIQTLLTNYPAIPDKRLVQYSLAVRLAREDRYTEAAELLESIPAPLRAGRMRKVAALHADQSTEGKYALAVYLTENDERIYFNDRLWNMFQTYAIVGEDEAGFTKDERERQLALERKLRDDQEERWHAWQLFRQVVQEAGPTPLGKQAAQRAIVNLRRISQRFGREADIRAGDIEMSRWLHRNR
jgi:tetratricopeptide (TPR) repeat protein